MTTGLLAGAPAYGQSETIALDPINVEGRGGPGGSGSGAGGGARPETATGPVDGFVAKRTSTASKTDAAIIETPQAINIVPADQIAAQDAQTLTEAVRYTPGVVSGAYGGADARDDPITIRGFDANQFWDGLIVPGGFSRAATKPEPYGLERIEILKGPASVLYGQSAPGGLVNMVSKRPTDVARGEIMVEGGIGAGNFSRRQAQFDVFGPADTDGKLLYRFIGLARDADTMVDDQPDDRLFIAPSLTFKPSEDTTITWLNHFSRDNGGVFQQLPAKGTIRPNPNGRLPISRNAGEAGYDFFHADYAATGYVLDHRFSESVKFSQTARYGRYRDDYAGILIWGLRDDLRTADRSTYDYRSQIDAFSIDNRLNVDFATGPISHSVLVGLDYTKTRFANQYGTDDAPPIDIFDPVYNGYDLHPARVYQETSRSWNLGLYAQDIIRFDRLTVMAGLRHDRAEDRTVNLDADTGDRSAARQNPNAMTYRIGAVYQFANGFAPYLSYAESFELVPGTDRLAHPFKPTTGQQYEIGLRYAVPGQNAMVTLSAFDISQQNVLTTDPVDPFEQVQTGEVRVRGVELEAKASLARWDATAGLSYLDGEVTKSAVRSQIGLPSAQTPKWMASLWLDHRFGGALNGLTLGGGVRHMTRFHSYQPEAAGEAQVPATTLFDAHLRYDFGVIDQKYKGVSLDVTAINIFDKRNYAVVTSDFTTYGPGRKVTANLAYRW